MPVTDELHFEQELERLFDADRIFAKHGRCNDEEFVKELRAYYAALSSAEKAGFDRAVLRYLLDRFRGGVDHMGLDARSRPMTRSARRKLVAEFRRGLEGGAGDRP